MYKVMFTTVSYEGHYWSGMDNHIQPYSFNVSNSVSQFISYACAQNVSHNRTDGLEYSILGTRIWYQL